MFNRIVVGTNGSTGANIAVNAAIELAQVHGATFMSSTRTADDCVSTGDRGRRRRRAGGCELDDDAILAEGSGSAIRPSSGPGRPACRPKRTTSEGDPPTRSCASPRTPGRTCSSSAIAA